MSVFLLRFDKRSSLDGGRYLRVFDGDGGGGVVQRAESVYGRVGVESSLCDCSCVTV